MKRVLKTITAIILVLATVLTLSACGATAKAESAVNGMFRAFKRLDFDAAEKYVDVDAFNLSELGNDLSGNTELFMRYLFGKMSYKIISSEEIDENKVEVKTEVTAVALGPVLVKFIGASMEYSLSNLFADPKPTDEEVAEKMEEIMKEIVADEGLKMTTTEVVVQVVQENGKWRVSSEDTLVDALFGGITDALADIAGLS